MVVCVQAYKVTLNMHVCVQAYKVTLKEWKPQTTWLYRSTTNSTASVAQVLLLSILLPLPLDYLALALLLFPPLFLTRLAWGRWEADFRFLFPSENYQQQIPQQIHLKLQQQIHL